ncbi:MAG TPA: ATP-binding protein [Pirellulales bacterium]|nr:ATP-binding protein [Pirellulales bacterium]
MWAAFVPQPSAVRDMATILVSADVKRELAEISSDFAKPIEVLRESLHNSYDAGAKNVRIVAEPETLTDGRRVLTITISDDGQGMSREMLAHFFGLGYSEKPAVAGRSAIGYKGHGTKIYYQASEIAVLTCQDGVESTFVRLTDARDCVYQKRLPAPEELSPAEGLRAGLQLIGPTGTTIRLRDFTPNSVNLIDAFYRDPVESYLRWFTVFGSFQHVVYKTKPDPPLQLWLQGIGESSPRLIDFGHRWPDADVTALKVLQQKDERRPFNYFRKTFAAAQRTIEGGYKIDVAALFEGRRGRLDRDADIKRQGRAGHYFEEERYGLWLCRDYIPVEARFDWLNIEEHDVIPADLGRPLILLNCQDFSLTANRGSVGNSSASLLAAVRQGLIAFIDEISADRDLTKFLNEYQEDLFSRLREKDKRALQRRVTRYNGRQECRVTLPNGTTHTFFEPTREITLFGLISELQILDPTLLGLEILDYDDHSGIDLLVRKGNTPDDLLDAKRVAYVELKFLLGSHLNHTFDHLSALVCWDLDVKDGASVWDASNNEFRMHVTVHGDTTHARLIPPPPNKLQHNITVIVLKTLLEERCQMRCRKNPRPVLKNGRNG